MNISPDGSPISTPSSGSPPPEEIGASYAQSSSATGTLLSMVAQTLSPSSKRRMPGSRPSRESKARRTTDDIRRGAGSSSMLSYMETREGPLKRSEKDEMVDHHIVEVLRKDVGDPFKEIP